MLPGDEVVMVSGAYSWHHLMTNKRDLGDSVLVSTAKVRMYVLHVAERVKVLTEMLC